MMMMMMIMMMQVIVVLLHFHGHMFGYFTGFIVKATLLFFVTSSLAHVWNWCTIKLFFRQEEMGLIVVFR